MLPRSSKLQRTNLQSWWIWHGQAGATWSSWGKMLVCPKWILHFQKWRRHCAVALKLGKDKENVNTMEHCRLLHIVFNQIQTYLQQIAAGPAHVRSWQGVSLWQLGAYHAHHCPRFVLTNSPSRSTIFRNAQLLMFACTLLLWLVQNSLLKASLCDIVDVSFSKRRLECTFMYIPSKRED